MKLYKLLLISEPSDRERLRRFGVAICSVGYSGIQRKHLAEGGVSYPSADPEARNFQTSYLRAGREVLVGTCEFDEVEWPRMRDILAGPLGQGLTYCLWQWEGFWVKTKTDTTGTKSLRPVDVLQELNISQREVQL